MFSEGTGTGTDTMPFLSLFLSILFFSILHLTLHLNVTFICR